ncbi:unnamed protein product [Clonostachys rhizophaga]|uniref:Uncharacterized protein n=1 Tax=Clonostachys rhizophaga TaxID=160324 RepID=A0A9N9W496_9HYPO|nr:unnamed protein product [Clonostachys rhizophaga]
MRATLGPAVDVAGNINDRDGRFPAKPVWNGLRKLTVVAVCVINQVLAAFKEAPMHHVAHQHVDVRFRFTGALDYCSHITKQPFRSLNTPAEIIETQEQKEIGWLMLLNPSLDPVLVLMGLSSPPSSVGRRVLRFALKTGWQRLGRVWAITPGVVSVCTEEESTP